MHIEMGFPRILLEAEVSNLSRPSSGHQYFTLKDDKAQVRCALFRSAGSRSDVTLENGMRVLARGRISLYEPRGDFQLIVDHVQEAGEGELLRQFEELKNRLESEGLFAPGRKRPLPPYPRKIALITSPGGAAVRDLLHVLGRRWPLCRVRLYPVVVQGAAAAAEIRAAIRAANRHGWAEVLIVGRGGGSLEDLAAFNDEALARDVSASTMPVVSAVGHETDFTICDFVADLRAPTPSAAAELTTPDQAVVREAFGRLQRLAARRTADRLQRDTQRLDHLAHRLQQRHPATRLGEQSKELERLKITLFRAMKQHLESRQSRLEGGSHRLAAHRPDRQLAALAQRIAALSRSLERLARNSLRSREEKLRDLARTLNAVSPLDVIGRGYAVLTQRDSGVVVSSVKQVASGERVDAQLSDGKLRCIVE